MDSTDTTIAPKTAPNRGLHKPFLDRASGGEAPNRAVGLGAFLVMRLVDVYTAVVLQVSSAIELELDTPWERFQLHSLKYHSTRAAFDIAISTRPDEALLDLLVLVSLERSACWSIVASSGGNSSSMRRRTSFREF